MKIKHLGSGIVLIEDLLSQDQLSLIDFNKIKSKCTPQGYVKVDGKDVMEGGYVIPAKDLSTMPIRYKQGIEDFLFYQIIDEAIYRGSVEYCALFPVSVESITNVIGKHFVMYLPGGSMGIHSDSSLAYKAETVEPVSTIALGNTVTVSVVLNDQFEGGSINFRTWDIKISPKAGSALFYPSSYIGAHEVSEVTSGVRWIFLATLAHGDVSFVTQYPQIEKYAERYDWTMKFKEDIRKKLNTKQENLNNFQKKVF